MFLKKLSALSKKVSYRLTFAILLFFIPTYIFIFFAFDILATRHLENRDHEQIESHLQTYQDTFEKEGVDGVKKIIANPRLHNQSQRFLVQIADENNKTVFMHLPEETDKITLNYTQDKLSQFTNLNDKGWSFIASEDGDEDAIEVQSVLLTNNYHLRVGASTDARDDLLLNFRRFFIAILVPLVFLTFFGALLISRKMLSPLKSLSKSIEQIKSGQLSTRTPLPKSKDELYELSLVFNSMIHQIEDLVRAIKETLDNVAHDLKTPLTRTRMASELALQKNIHLDLKIAAEENIENTDSMLKIVQTIMEVARLDSKTLVLNKESFGTKKIFDEIVDLYFFVAEEKKIALHLNVTDLQIYADRLMFKQALANLLDNAIKYSNYSTQILLSFLATDTHYFISVKDSGIGISSDDLPRIWERLFRADRSRHQPGLGLGLSMVKIFADSHLGKIEVKSQIGVGSEFCLTIPKLNQ